MPLSPGDRFDRYTIEGLLGQGGMGQVFSAYDSRLKRRVAVKVLRPGPDGESTGGQSRLLREAQAAAALDHPNVVSVFDVGELDGEPYIVMELVAGRSLKSYVGDRSVPIPRKLGWLRDIAAALASAHGRGLVHRDVKPSNVMVRDDGVIKVYDFGIARINPTAAAAAAKAAAVRDAEEEAETLSRTGTIVGTPRYMSPEQLRSESVDGRADQFAWGVLAYELLTGTMPWKSMTPDVDLVAAILLQVPDPPRQLAPDLPVEVEAMILRALAKNAPDRFASMSDIVVALEPLISGSSRELAAAAAAAATASVPTALPSSSSASSASSASSSSSREDETLVDTGPQPSTGSQGTGTKTAHAVQKPDEGRGAQRKRRAIIAVVALAVAIGGVAIVSRRPWLLLGRHEPDDASVTSVQRRPTPVTDLPPPVSSVPAAIAAYNAGLQALRDGANRLAAANFAKAATLDPQMAAAHMRLGLYTFYSSSTKSREHLAIAQQRRNTLSPRDEAFLDALDPYIRRQPSDHEEYVRRLRAALERFPGDAELEMLLAYQRAAYEPSLAVALAGYDRAIALDPKFGMAYAYKSQEQSYRAEFETSLATADACVRAAPNATFCTHLKGGVEDAIGRCANLETTARQAIALEPSGDSGYHTLAKALYALDRPLDVVKVTLEQAWARPSEAGPAFDPKKDQVALHILAGRFDLAEQVAREMATAAKVDTSVAGHAKPAELLVEIYRETGQDPAATDIASAYLRQRAAWMPDPRGEDFAVGRDPAPMMLAVLRRAGKLTPEAFATQREAWATTWRAVLLPMYVRYAWIHGYAAPSAIIEAPDDARRSLEALSTYTDIPKFAPRTLAAANVGRTFFLADRNDDALTWLKMATSSCSAIDEPIAHTRAHFDLGLALERAGDTAGACRAYAVVVSRWGHAKPKSLTAARARDRAKALRCATPL